MSETYSDDGTAEELAESDAENNELIDGEWNATDKAYRPLVKELASLKQQLAEAQRDAARYRWLRENTDILGLYLEFGPAASPDACDKAIDAAIDQAMKGE